MEKNYQKGRVIELLLTKEHRFLDFKEIDLPWYLGALPKNKQTKMTNRTNNGDARNHNKQIHNTLLLRIMRSINVLNSIQQLLTTCPPCVSAQNCARYYT